MTSKIQSQHRPSHIPAMDGIRLLAVVLVMLHHVTGTPDGPFLHHLFGMQHGNGIGSPLFFVLSGLLLTKVILSARNTENRYRNFLTRRMLRTVPLYVAYMVAAVVITMISTGAMPSNIWVFALLLQNTFVEAANQTGSALPVYHFWSLAMQDQFYLFWPLLLWKCNSIRRMRQLCYAVIVLSLLARIIIAHPAIPFLRPEVLIFSLPSRAGELCLGALIALENSEQTLLTPALRYALLPLSLICGTWMWFGLDVRNGMGSTLGIQLIALVAAGLIAVTLAPCSWPSRILSSPLIAMGGKKYSFSMYVFHPAMLHLCSNLNIPSKGIRLGLFAVTTVLASALSYRFYERPFLQLPIGRPKPKAQPESLKPADTTAPNPGFIASTWPNNSRCTSSTEAAYSSASMTARKGKHRP